MIRMVRLSAVLCLLASVTWGKVNPSLPLAAHGTDEHVTMETNTSPHVTLPGASFDLPASWQREPPSTHMRAAQARIPGKAGAAELTVFYFGAGKGGSVDANIERWIGQVDQAAETQPQRAQFTSHGLTVTWVDVAGTLKPGGMGMGPATAQPNSRLLAAVVEGPAGPWFFRAVGPDGTLKAERDNFVAMLKSMRPSPAK